MQLPQPAWAVMLAVLGTGIAIVVLFHPDPQTISLGVLAVASNLVSGALGAFAGAAGANHGVRPPVTPPTDPAQ